MRLRCPRCRHDYDVREATRNQALIDIIKMQPEFGEHARLVWEYAELFETTRPLRPLKLLRVLKELRDIFVAGEFAFRRRRHRISKAGIASALKVVCSRSFNSPLENHNYLKKVMTGVSEEEEKRRSAAKERELREREARIRGRGGERLNEEQPPASLGDVTFDVPWRK